MDCESEWNCCPQRRRRFDRCCRACEAGHVAIYSDYLYPGTPGTLSALLGGPVLVASAAVSVALRTGATVIPLSVARNWPPEGGGVEVRFFSPLPLADLDPRPAFARDGGAPLRPDDRRPNSPQSQRLASLGNAPSSLAIGPRGS